MTLRVELHPEDVIDGKYRVVEPIGSGNYGDVFKVADKHGQSYALKLLHLFDVPSDTREMLEKRFRQGYEVGQIDSDHLIHSIDFGVLKGNPYLLMELCPDGDLSKLIGKDTTRLPLYAHDILKGLHALHTAGKVHRDLKPENVLIRPNGKAALTDFDVAGNMDKKKRLSVTNILGKPLQMHGTPLYMAPEMFDRAGGGVTYLPTVDIFSFGVMMYELVTGGSLPFGNIKHIEELPRYRERAKKGKWDKTPLNAAPYGEEWQPIIERCLMPNHRERYQHVTDILQDMTPLLGNTTPAASKREPRNAALSRLVITQGDNQGAVFHLADHVRHGKRMVHVGREKDNDIVLSERETTYVSRFHFTLEQSADRRFWTIRDGQWRKSERQWVTSTNGTYLNATPVPPEGIKVFTGDIITAGEYNIKVE